MGEGLNSRTTKAESGATPDKVSLHRFLEVRAARGAEDGEKDMARQSAILLRNRIINVWRTDPASSRVELKA